VRFSRPWTVFQARRALAGELKRGQYDVVIVHSAWAHAVFAPVVRRAGKRLVWWLHNRVQGNHWSERWARWTRPDVMICVSHSTAETTRCLFRDIPTEIVYAPHPAVYDNWPADHAAQVRAELQTSAADVVIIQVSRMEAWKGHVIHLKALAALRDIPGWVCWQVGGPSSAQEDRYFQELAMLAAELGLQDRVRFLGRRSDVPRLLAAADLFCQPNLDTEGFSIAFMEAFLARLPIVTSAIGGAVEIIDDSCGMLLPVGDVEALAGVLRRLIADSAVRKQMGAAGHERVRRLCDPEQQLQKLGRVFARVAGKVPEYAGAP
jgi:glycosyltransferase involved in cell wall biosynthesis